MYSKYAQKLRTMLFHVVSKDEEHRPHGGSIIYDILKNLSPEKGPFSGIAYQIRQLSASRGMRVPVEKVGVLRTGALILHGTSSTVY